MNFSFFELRYHPKSINSDNGSITQKILLESELLTVQNVDMSVAYSCVKYGVFITTGFDAVRICILHLECSWSQNLNSDPFSFGGRVDKGCRMFVWIVTVATYVFSMHKGFIKVTAPLTSTWFFWARTVARQQYKMHNGEK